MKELYRKRSETRDTRVHGRGIAGAGRADSYGARRRNRRRNRGNGVVLLVACALLAAGVAGYLLNEGEILRTNRLGESATNGETEFAVSSQRAGDQEEAADDEGAGEPTVLLGQFRTDYAWDPDPGRQANLKMASEAIDETLLAPGEEFSAIEVLEPLDYEPAKVFANGGVDYTDGGGLCQVTSTLYMAASYAGLEITDRNQHYAEVPYIRPGFDATVWFGAGGTPPLDMKFRNNTGGNVLVREWVDDKGFLNAQIYGEEPTGKTVTMDSEKVEEDLNEGIKWATYKKVTDEDGEVLEDGLLYESVYSYNPPVPEELKHETDEPRVSGWLDATNTTNWNN